MTLTIKRIAYKLKEIKKVEKKEFNKIEKGTPLFKTKNPNKERLNEFWNKFILSEIKGKRFGDYERKYYKITPTVLGTVRFTKTNNTKLYGFEDPYLKAIKELYNVHPKVTPQNYILAPVEIIDYVKLDNKSYILERVIPAINGDKLIRECSGLKGSSNPYVKILLKKTGFYPDELAQKFNTAFNELLRNFGNHAGTFDIHKGNILISDYDVKQKKFILHFVDII